MTRPCASWSAPPPDNGGPSRADPLPDLKRSQRGQVGCAGAGTIEAPDLWRALPDARSAAGKSLGVIERPSFQDLAMDMKDLRIEPPLFHTGERRGQRRLDVPEIPWGRARAALLEIVGAPPRGT